MTRTALALAAMVAGLMGILFTGLGSGIGSATHLNLAHITEVQTFNVDNQTCRGGSSDLTGTETADTFPPGVVCAGETLTTGTTVAQYQDTIIADGTKLSLGVNWSDQAFGILGSAGIAGDDVTQVGDVISAINIACDDTVDYFADSSSTLPLEGGFGDSGAVREQFLEDEPAVPAAGQPDGFLEAIMPPNSIYTKTVRYEADVNFVTLGTSFPVNLAAPVSLNAVVMDATFGDARASVTTLGGDANAPSAQLVLCLDSPQTSIAQINTTAGLSNPTTAGLYANWTTYISAAGLRDETSQQAGYVTNCKAIGGAQADADNDCLEDADDADDADNDQDNDGLLDGIDASFMGSAACSVGNANPILNADCDGDDKTDLEEMLQVSAGLTNPRDADSDDDTLADSGLIIDCDGNGAPDSATSAMDTDNGNGRNRLMWNVVYCKPTETTGGLGGRPVGNPGAASDDNCPTKANLSQVNSSTVDVNLVGTPDTNGRFPGSADNSHPDAKYTGDDCDGDDDNDGIPDEVEDAGTMFYNSAAPAGGAFCNTNAQGVAADTDTANRDSDGDSIIDGVECQLGRNPAVATSPTVSSFNPEQTTYYRLSGLTQPGATPALGAIDDGSTIGGIPESRGMSQGAGAVNDHDRDGCADETEIVDLDGNRSVTSADYLAIARAVQGVGAFAPPGSAQADLEERRAGDIDFNGTLTSADSLGAARIGLTASLPAIPDYNLNCTAGTTGYAAT